MAQSIDLDVTEELNINAKRGDTFSMTLTLKDSAGTALTLSTSNYEFFFRVKGLSGVGAKRKMGILLGTPNVSQADNNFETPTLDDSGNVTFKASADVTDNISSGAYSYEIQYKLPSSSSLDSYVSILKGSFILNANITENVT
tara:strand:+ start:405 stop:833 length:429 start_codon:yes stop_codon:yes gene_type:complete